MIDEILIDIKHRMDQAVSHTNLELNKSYVVKNFMKDH